MKYASTIAAIVALAAILSCGNDTESSPTPTTHLARTPTPLAAIPEGTLLMQEHRSGYEASQLYAIGTGGGMRGFGEADSPVVSPDGTRIALVDSGTPCPAGKRGTFSSKLKIVSADGEQLYFSESMEASCPGWSFVNTSWSMDGSTLAYTMPSDQDSNQSHLYTVDANGDERRLTAEPGYYYPLGWTNVGRLLVSAGGVWPTDSGRLLLFGETVETLPSPDHVILQSTLSPDRQKVAIEAGEYDKNLWELWVLEIESGVLRMLTSNEIDVRHEGDLYVSARAPSIERHHFSDSMLKGPPPIFWSPDSSRIAYFHGYAISDNKYTSDLRVVNVESGEDALVAKNSWRFPAWSLDGRQLAFVRDADDLTLMRPDGRIADLDVRATEAVWSKSGLLVISTSTGLALYDPESMTSKQVQTGDEKPVYSGLMPGYGYAVWSPSGRYLAFWKQTDISGASGEAYLLDTKTGTATRLLERSGLYPVAWLTGEA